jgi:hypothetical protein
MPSTRIGGVNGIKVISTSRAQAGGTLRALSDTSVVNPADGYLLVYNGTTQLWTAQSSLGDNTEIDGGSF